MEGKDTKVSTSFYHHGSFVTK